MTSAQASSDPVPAHSPRDQAAPLTARQIDCLRWVQEGKTAWEIGQILGISNRTVESYLAIAFERLEVNTRVQAVLKARALGLL